ncbi:MAG: ABC transporter ATP-binding protein [Candidatus Omnitrophica bacterium]|nr:ABC transporter ATP-binding protein [Candidatus Omnitrophota bacterium]MCM8798174.1 ABC transporter ATP-binding protein [Candidatus Omnitrophota bacterium]
MLEARNLYKLYDTQKNPLEVLKGINLKVGKGEFTAIVGPSGAGKSTLLHILGGLESPTKGEVYFEGINLYNMSEPERAKIRNRKVGFVFQFYHLLPEFNILENVYLAGLVAGFRKRRECQERAKEMLTFLGLQDRLGHRPNELSGGEQQRVAIARALINEPALLLCDEPTGNLDSQMGELVLNYLVDLNRNKGQTIILVTHAEELAEKAQRIVYIKDGTLVRDVPVTKIRA